MRLLFLKLSKRHSRVSLFSLSSPLACGQREKQEGLLMANLKSDSTVCRRIVLAFLDFLKSVEPASGVDLEGLEVARECLEEVFKVNSSSIDDQTQPGLLVNFFSSMDANIHEIKSDLGHVVASVDTSTSSAQTVADVNFSEASKSEGRAEEYHTLGVSKDELFGQFFGALEKIHFFKTMPDGDDDQVQLDKATHLFHDALMEMEKSGCQTINRKNLAETLKTQGNRVMQSKLYTDAIELYTCAIALCENNAVYYCNRAAAYTQIQKYSEAIKDCLKSIEINPNYIKAYSRLGLAYFAQGNYSDAINKGFMRALQLDPNSDSVKENIRVAEQKLREEQQRTEHDQTTGFNHQQSNSQFTGGSSNHGAPPPFTSIPFNAASLPADFASMLMNMATTAYQGQQAQDRPHEDSDVDGFEEPQIRIGGNVSVNFGEELPEELTGAWRSMMEMFSGATPQEHPPGNMNGGSAPN